MNIPFVDLKAQYLRIRPEVDAAIARVLSEAAFIGGSHVKAFEEAFATYCGVQHCVGVGNGTDAITIALRGLGIGPGDEVITAANSFIASAEAISNAGARVVFADVGAESYTLDPDRVEAAITPRTRAILVVHLYGQPAQMDALLELGRARGLHVIEDAAQAHGAEWQGRPVGSLGSVACFSFYPGKNLGAYGDGGAIVTDDAELADRVRMLANHGRVSKYDHGCEGFNSRLDGIQAAILFVKLACLDRWNRERNVAAARYDELLRDTRVVTPARLAGAQHVFHLYVVRVPERDRIRAALAEQGIEVGVHYPIALPNLSAYRYLGHAPSDFPVATRCSGEILSLPIFPELSEEQIAEVCGALRRLL